MRQIIECIPNISEGRNHKIIEKILKSITDVPGIILMGYESDHDHHRSVITFAGEPEAVMQAAFQMVKAATKLIDLSKHAGVHPRLGALDVLPFVPLKNITFDETVDLAHKLGQRLGQALHIPVHLYEKAAKIPAKKNLANLRKFAGTLKPDFGPENAHATAGAICLGVRKILIAFNVNIKSLNPLAAAKIAAKIRESSGGLPAVKALAFHLLKKNCHQISMNLVDYGVTKPIQAYKAIEELVGQYDAEILESELIGLIPKDAISKEEALYMKLKDFSESRIIENHLL